MSKRFAFLGLTLEVTHGLLTHPVVFPTCSNDAFYSLFCVESKVPLVTT
jgi:hypothetical protein